MKKIFKIFSIVLYVIIFMQITVHATSLDLQIHSNEEKIKIGDEIKIKVSWNEPMQAADFSLNYNSKKVQYISSDLDDVFVNNQLEKGKVKTAWFSMDDTNKTEVEYTFKVIKGGKIKFSTSTEGGFATGNLETPKEYNEGKLTIKVPGNYTMIYVLSIIIIVIIIIFIKKWIRGK